MNQMGNYVWGIKRKSLLLVCVQADVLPTSGGGAQIVFNDIEYLKQISPVRARRRWVNLEEGSAHSANASHTTPKTVR